MTSTTRARELGPRDWILSFFSLRYADFEERLGAASAAGFSAIGLLTFEYERLLRKGWNDADMKAALDRHGIVIAEIEALLGWAAEDNSGAKKQLETACHMGEVFGSRHLQAIGPYDGSIADASRRFAEVCDRAAEDELLVAIEFLPSNNICDAGVTLEIVQGADRPNGGICLDVWHHFRGANDDALLDALPPDRVINIQLSDGPLTPDDPDYLADCLENRRPVGEGEFAIGPILERLDRKGCRAPHSFEVISKTLQQLPHDEAAHRIAAGARTL